MPNTIGPAPAAIAEVREATPAPKSATAPRKPAAAPDRFTAVGSAKPNLVPGETFLPNAPADQHRRQLWAIYEHAEPLARGFAVPPDRYVPVVKIDSHPPPGFAGWWDGGQRAIQIQVDAGDEGALAHELFHPAYFASPLNAGSDTAWAEAFADGFRYVVERAVMPEGSEWLRRMDDIAHLSLEQAKAKYGDGTSVTRYWFPGALVIRASGGTLEGLQQLWDTLVARRQAAGTDVLAAHFQYAL